MARINEDIISEIQNLSGTPEPVREFLKWLVDFENTMSDKDQYSYKNEIERKIELAVIAYTSMEGQ